MSKTDKSLELPMPVIPGQLDKAPTVQKSCSYVHKDLVNDLPIMREYLMGHALKLRLDMTKKGMCPNLKNEMLIKG